MDWQALADLLAARLNFHWRGLNALPLQGGNISQAFRLEDGSHQFFVKINRSDALPMFNAEVNGLDAIRNCDCVRVPEVFATGCIDDHAFIAMEYIELDGRINDEQLAAALAAMHSCTQQQFGFHSDNMIGSTAQSNTPTDNWLDFWRQHRLGFQLELARDRGLDAALIDAGERLSEILQRFFCHQPRASLLHGDLWRGNYAADSSGQCVLYDPACYFGDHETDLAMMELFGHPGERFFKRYKDEYGIDDGYPMRRDLYNLYHLLNHANLFAGGYPAQALRSIQSLLSQV